MDTNIRYRFRSTAFGGFNREDVAAYIETAAKAAQEELSAVKREADHLQNSLEAQRERTAGLTAKNEELSRLLLETESKRDTSKAELDKARKENAALSEQVRAMQDQIAALEAELNAVRLRPAAPEARTPAPAPPAAQTTSFAAAQIPAPPVSPAYAPAPGPERQSVRALLDAVRPPAPEKPPAMEQPAAAEKSEAAEIPAPPEKPDHGDTAELPCPPELASDIKVTVEAPGASPEDKGLLASIKIYYPR